MLDTHVLDTNETVHAVVELADGLLTGKAEEVLVKLLDKVLLNQVLKSEHYGTILCLVEVFVATRRPV